MTRSRFKQLLAEHRELIRLTNELEYHLFRLGESAEPERVTACQQSAGALIGLLRQVLFQHDQEVLPVLAAAAADDVGEALP